MLVSFKKRKKKKLMQHLHTRDQMMDESSSCKEESYYHAQRDNPQPMKVSCKTLISRNIVSNKT